MTSAPTDFVRDRVKADIAAGVFSGRVQTRFPPEPNGYLHIGHAKAIGLAYSLAAEFDGICNLRFDDTNPITENEHFVDGIIEDMTWLGFPPTGPVLFASDYFDQLYEWAEQLIEAGHAYVDEQDGETISAQRGRFGNPGIESPHRNRQSEENLDLFRRMRDGEFQNGAMVLRAKIDMQHQNMQMRDPVMYRIRRGDHYRTGSRWVIYPTYDWAHGQSDAIEGVTHSLCSLEFDSHRELYDWFLDHLTLPFEQPTQTEFARLEFTHTITSKRRLAQLVADGSVDGWDDPRMPTLRGLRNRGYPAKAIREFCTYVGVAKTNSRHEIEMLESFVRTELNKVALRRTAVLNPLKITIENYPADTVEMREAINNPEDASAGTREVPFTRTLYIERDDFMLEPAPKFYRLAPGREVRLRYGYFITCTEAIVDETGEVTELKCTYDPETGGGSAPDGRKVKATLHWVSAEHAGDATVVLYDRLFEAEVPGTATGNPLDDLNPGSRTLLTGTKVEPALANAEPGLVVQFERLGYFAHDREVPGRFHRTVGLRDEWANIQKRQPNRAS